MKHNTFPMTILSVLLAGCAVGPDYVTPATPPIALATAYTLPVQTATAHTPWWTFFDDARLTQLIETALLHNHDIRQAYANLAASRALFDERQLERMPAVTAQAGVQRNIRQQGTSDNAQRQLSQNSYAQFDAQWEIDLFGRLQRLSNAAQARTDATAAELAQTRLTIASEVARHYYALLGLNTQLQVAREQVQSWQETVHLLVSRTNAGLGLAEDTENARANVQRSQAAIPPLLASIQATQFRLDILTGQHPGVGDRHTAMLSSPFTGQLPIGDVNQLIRQRPDVLKAERLLAASTEDVGATTADLYPRLNLGGFIGFFALRGSALGSSATRAFEIAPNVSWPMLQLGNARARLRGVKAQSDSALARYEQALLLAQEDVENAVTRLVLHQQRLGALLQSATHGSAAVDIATKRYRAGSGSYMAVLENQRAMYQIRQEVAEAETASYLFAIALYKALGWGIDGDTRT